MASYRLLIKASAQKELLAVQDKKQRQRLVAKIAGLAGNPRPHGCQKLAGAENLYRLRQGQYRIVYEIREAELVVLVIKLGHRREIYREL